MPKRTEQQPISAVTLWLTAIIRQYPGAACKYTPRTTYRERQGTPFWDWKIFYVTPLRNFLIKNFLFFNFQLFHSSHIVPRKYSTISKIYPFIHCKKRAAVTRWYKPICVNQSQNVGLRGVNEAKIGLILHTNYLHISYFISTCNICRVYI